MLHLSSEAWCLNYTKLNRTCNILRVLHSGHLLCLKIGVQKIRLSIASDGTYTTKHISSQSTISSEGMARVTQHKVVHEIYYQKEI